MTIGTFVVDKANADPNEVQAGLRQLDKLRRAGEWAYGENVEVGTLTCATCGLTIKATERSPGTVGFDYPPDSHSICTSKARPQADKRPEALSCPDLNRPYMRYLNILMASFAPNHKKPDGAH